ncbi:MAG: hypothetical protein KIT87_23120 [Anaerolineae bacterium]|nr:hypothetical protein [Anaerolineae bacterium]
MSHILILELSDDTYAALVQRAEASGVSPALLATDSLTREFINGEAAQTESVLLTDLERQAARERFEAHFGAVDLGYPTGADNESIDADLAREYASAHEAG